MSYEVVFDAARSVYTTTEVATSGGIKHWSSLFWAVFVLFLALGLILISMRQRLSNTALLTSSALLFVAWLSASKWMLPTMNISTHTGPPKVVVGSVRNFVAMAVEAHAQEHFCVQTACFHYSDYVHNGGFNESSSHGGPIKEGLAVRVTYVEHSREPGNVIVKLEIEK